MVDQAALVGEHLGWAVEDAVTLGNTATTHVVCTNAKMVLIETSHALDIGFAAAEADITDNDIMLPAGVHSLVVPKAIGNATILNYRRGSSTSTLVRVILS